MSKLIGMTFHYEDGTTIKARANDIVVNVGQGGKTNYINADECPIHGPWRAVPGGSKDGRDYPAFWSCDVAKGEERCRNKPHKDWVETHPPERVLPRKDSNDDFDSLPF